MTIGDGWMDCYDPRHVFFHPTAGVKPGTLVRNTTTGETLCVVEIDQDNLRIRVEPLRPSEVSE